MAEAKDTAETVTVRGELRGLRRIRTRRRGLTLVQGSLTEGGSELKVVWFNRPWLLQQVEEGRRYVLHGRLREGRRRAELMNPSLTVEEEFVGGLVPIYPRIGELGPEAVRRLLEQLLERLDLEAEIEDPLPTALLERRALPPLGRALSTLHRPPADVDVAALERGETAAHARLIYGELFELQRRLERRRRRRAGMRKAHRYRIDDRTRSAVRELLPFRLTTAQRRVLGEIVEDLRGPGPMSRLLQGDVGCGKTIVAALAAAVAIESELQVAFMAPTELLAEQHHDSLRRLLGDRYRVELLTGSSEDAAEVRRRLADGEVQLVIGTHALIQRDTRFARLGLAVIDEQHRFGVEQRQALATRASTPDVLVMTATPIPRSLALTLYGDLELSVIDELPPGRTPVRTRVLPAQGRREVYDELRRELDAGGQAYVVVPFVEGSEAVAGAAVEEELGRIRAMLDGHRVEALHGRLDRSERIDVMGRFVSGEIRVLLATTVIEVGVDVANASWMVIESAERFGLSQLHQLRGRVGRGSRRSTCVALHGELTEAGEQRLGAFQESGDGFRIAEEDLRIRGPGELLGTRQAGRLERFLANPLRHWRWLEAAREDARELASELVEPSGGDRC